MADSSESRETPFKFRAYPSIDTTRNATGRNKSVQDDREWVVTEKVHGSNTSIYCDAQGNLGLGRRTGMVEGWSSHFRCDIVIDRLRSNIEAAAAEVLRRHAPGVQKAYVIFYGEVYGGVYRDLPCLPGLMVVQRGLNYTTDVAFTCFDVLVINPAASEAESAKSINDAIEVWRSVRKGSFVLSKSRRPEDRAGAVETLTGALERAQTLIAEGVTPDVVGSLTALSAFAQRMLDTDGVDVDLKTEFPPVPSRGAPAHETLLSVDERVALCDDFSIPSAPILFRGPLEEATAFSRATRGDPTTYAARHGMPEPHDPREGNVVRTNLPTYVGERAELAIFKDKNSAFKEVQYAKKDAKSGDLIAEAPRFITQQRVDAVRSKFDPAQCANLPWLAERVAEDALDDMKRKTRLAPLLETPEPKLLEDLTALLLQLSLRLVSPDP